MLKKFTTRKSIVLGISFIVMLTVVLSMCVSAANTLPPGYSPPETTIVYVTPTTTNPEMATIPDQTQVPLATMEDGSTADGSNTGNPDNAGGGNTNPGQKNNPATGDNTLPIVILTILSLAAVGAGIVVVRKQKNNAK